MHPYSIDTEERKYILLLLAIASVLLALGFSSVLSFYKISLAWWMESPSVLFFYGLLFLIFDHWGWKIFRRIGLIKTPDINGLWKGHLKTSFDNHASEMAATLSIFQKWTRIKINLSTEKSVSHSETASFLIEPPEGKYLNYQYINEPKSNAAETMSIHRGTVRLVFNESENTLSGEYYSGRDRQNFGSLYFTKQS